MHRQGLCGLVALALICTTGCGAIHKGKRSTIAVTSRPAGAEVFVDGRKVATTPADVPVVSREPHEIVLEAPGQRDQVVYLEPDLHEVYLAVDLLLLLPGILPGVVALIVDGSTGSWYRAEPREVSAVMLPSSAQPPEAAATAEPARTPAPEEEQEEEQEDEDEDEDEDAPPAPPPLIPDEELPPPPPPD